ncbi:MAG: restriction endonuclease [Chloroflexi bacterium CG07_land_8_20_14_0_80_45_17]|nr:MAG: restriction endonuclease [Chloroflexi bacterium CG07_land_8_20_14_0_80_45_17]
MAKAKIKFTYKDYLQLPEDKRYELVEGEFFMVPSPNYYHQVISKRLFRTLDDYVRKFGLGEVLYAPLDVILSEENVLQPDILFISKERFNIITNKNIQGAPDLIIEILSSATAGKDRGLKQKLYAKFGVSEYWLVDPDKETIEVLTLAEEGFESIRAYQRGEILESPLLKGIPLALTEIF